MKKIVPSLIFLVALGVQVIAQTSNVGIGTNVPQTKLQVAGAISSTPTSVAAADNVTIPDNVSVFRLMLTSGGNPTTLTLNNPKEGQYLTIYNEDDNAATFAGQTIAASNGIVTMQYINTGWRLTAETHGGTTGWSTGGNAGTVPGTNFIGTSDNNALDVRTNNVLHEQITTKGQIYEKNTGFSTFLGENAGDNDVTTSQNASTYLGYRAGANTTSGENVFVGAHAGESATTAQQNVAVGNGALQNAGAGFNTSVGYAASNTNTTGTNNTSLGYFALNKDATGSNNTALGSGAGQNATGSRNVFLGNGAGQSVTAGNDKLYIANTNTVSPLISGDFAASQVGINGALAVGAATPDNSAALDVSATNKGVRFPNVNLQNATDATTIPSPAKGLVVWNTGVSFGSAALYVNTGSPGSPTWDKVSTGAGTVAGVSASSPLSSSGGTNPNISLTGTVPVGNGGTGLTAIGAGQVLIGTTAGSFLNTTLTGTANQVNINSTSGAVTLSTPQDIAASSSPSFAKVNATGANQNDIVSSSSIQVGNNSATAATAGGGSIRYNGSAVQFSDGTNWNNVSSGGTVTSVTGTAPIVSSGGATPAISLANTTVAPGAYTNANLIVDAQGRITAASNGTTGTVTGVTASNGLTSSGGTAPNITLGGTLTGATTITTASAGNNLTINSTVAASTSANAETMGNLVINRSNPGGTGGELTIRNAGGAAVVNSSAVLAFETDGSTAFDAAGANSSNAEIRAINTTTTNGADLVFSNWSGGGEFERMRINAVGNVGIGTATPRNTFDLNGSGIIRGGLIMSGGSTNYTYYTTAGVSTAYNNMWGGTPELFVNGDNHGGGGLAISDDGGFYDYNDAYVTFNGSTGLRIAGTSGAASTGNLVIQGLGTGIVKSNAGTLVLATAGDFPSLSGNYVDLTSAQTAAGVKTWSNNAIFNGTVGIGTSTPGDLLEIRGNTNGNLGARITNTAYFAGQSDALGFYHGTVFNSPNSPTVQHGEIRNTLNVSGTGGSVMSLSVSNTSNVLTQRMSIDQNGAVTMNALGSGLVKSSSGLLSIAGAGDIPSLSGSYVDLSSAQTAGGVKTWSSNAFFNSNVGIGTTTPRYTFDLNAAGIIRGGLMMSGGSTSYTYYTTAGVSTAYTNLYGGSPELFLNGDNHAGGGLAISDDGGFYDYNDAYITFNGSTGLKIAGASGASSTGNLVIQGLGTGIVKSTGGVIGLASAGDIPSLSGTYVDLSNTQTAAGAKTWSGAGSFTAAGTGLSVSNNATIGGTMTAGTYMFPAPTGDPSPVITARTVPSGQGSAPEKTELLLFHSNDNATGGAGTDQITLRAPALSFQTYNYPSISGIGDNNGYNERMYINPDGLVGIGTTTPAAKLDVSGGTISGTLMGLYSGSVATIENGTSNNFLNFRNSVDNSTYGGILFSDNNLGGFIVFRNCCAAGNSDDMIYGSYTDHVFQNGSAGTVDGLTETMRIKQNGNVGIGTNNPQSLLQVNGDTRFGCRSGFWAVGDGRICMDATMRGPGGVWTAIATCKTVGPGSRVCTHTDFQEACGAGLAPYANVAPGWYGDHGVSSGGNWDDEYGTWNGGACNDNNDGPAHDGSEGLSYNFRCCY